MPPTNRLLRLGLTGMLVLAWAAIAAASPGTGASLTVYRCLDAKGKTSLQDFPCADGRNQEKREMARPKDGAVPPPAETAPRPALPVPEALERARLPAPAPPDLYRCTDFDGKARDSEYHDPKPRCVPLWVLGYETRSNACRWVEDSCVRYEGAALCERWRQRQKDAELEARLSFGNKSAFAESEAERIAQIVRTSCIW